MSSSSSSLHSSSAASSASACSTAGAGGWGAPCRRHSSRSASVSRRRPPTYLHGSTWESARCAKTVQRCVMCAALVATRFAAGHNAGCWLSPPVKTADAQNRRPRRMGRQFAHPNDQSPLTAASAPGLMGARTRCHTLLRGYCLQVRSEQAAKRGAERKIHAPPHRPSAAEHASSTWHARPSHTRRPCVANTTRLAHLNSSTTRLPRTLCTVPNHQPYGWQRRPFHCTSTSSPTVSPTVEAAPLHTVHDPRTARHQQHRPAG